MKQKNIGRWLWLWVRRILGAAILAGGLWFFMFPGLTVCYYILTDKGLHGNGVSSFALYRHKVLSDDYAKYARERIASGKAENLHVDQIAETEWPLFGSCFYLWATALARRGSGENQYYTALALHELYTAAGDPIIREQAKRAYRNVLDNFFSSVTVFECCGEFFPFPREDTAFAFPLNELVLERLVRAQETTPEGYPGGYTPLYPDDPDTVNNDPGLIELETAEAITEWGYVYRCAGSGEDRTCFVSVAEF